MGSYANAQYLCLPLVRLKAVRVEQHSCEVPRGFTDQTKPAEVSCKSCCASLGAHSAYLVLVTVQYSSCKPGERSVPLTSLSSGGSSPSQELQQGSCPRSSYCCSAGVTAGGWVSLCLRPCLQRCTSWYLHPEWSRQSRGTTLLLPAPLQEQ